MGYYLFYFQVLVKIATYLTSPIGASPERQLAAAGWLACHRIKWAVLVGAPTRYDILEVSNNRRLTEPSTADILLFGKRTSELLEEAIDKFEQTPSRETYKSLQKITIVKTIAFNRRRGQDVSGLNVTEWEVSYFPDSKSSFIILGCKKFWPHLVTRVGQVPYHIFIFASPRHSVL